MKKQNGITLIALVITIIVLLILAGVSISAITGENGIVEKAKQAKEETEAAQKKEEEDLQSIVDYMDDIEVEKSPELTLLERYMLGEDGKGKGLTDLVDFSTWNFIDDETTIPNASTEIISIFSSEDYNRNEYYVDVKYNNIAYRIKADVDTFITKSVEEYYIPQGNEGKKVKYDSNGNGTMESWMVLTDRNGVFEIIALDVKYDSEGNGLTLGSTDESVTVTKDLDGDGTIGNDVDIAIESYNNATKRINEFCNEIVLSTDNDGVRSIGGNADSFEEYTSSNLETYFKGIATFKIGNLNNIEDYTKIGFWGYAPSASYWMAEQRVSEEEEYIAFWMGDSFKGIATYVEYFVKILLDGGFECYSGNYGVIPVVINPQNYEYVTE